MNYGMNVNAGLNLGISGLGTSAGGINPSGANTGYGGGYGQPQMNDGSGGTRMAAMSPNMAQAYLSNGMTGQGGNPANYALMNAGTGSSGMDSNSMGLAGAGNSNYADTYSINPAYVQSGTYGNPYGTAQNGIGVNVSLNLPYNAQGMSMVSGQTAGMNPYGASPYGQPQGMTTTQAMNGTGTPDAGSVMGMMLNCLQSMVQIFQGLMNTMMTLYMKQGAGTSGGPVAATGTPQPPAAGGTNGDAGNAQTDPNGQDATNGGAGANPDSPFNNVDGQVGNSKVGSLGDGWLLCGINAAAVTRAGHDAILQSIQPNDDGSVSVTFKGDPKHKAYKVTPQEFAQAKELSTGDPDMRVLEIAFRKLIADHPERFGKKGNLDLLDPRGPHRSGAEAIRYLLGSDSKIYNSPIGFGKLGQILDTLGKSGKENAISMSFLHDVPGKIKAYAGYTLMSIDPEKKQVSVLNPDDSSTPIRLTYAEFEKTFGGMQIANASPFSGSAPGLPDAKLYSKA